MSIEADKQVVADATSGPWEWATDKPGTQQWVQLYCADETVDEYEADVLSGDGGELLINPRNAEFITAARTRWPLYIDLAEAVRGVIWHWEECEEQGEGPCCLDASSRMVAASHAIASGSCPPSEPTEPTGLPENPLDLLTDEDRAEMREAAERDRLRRVRIAMDIGLPTGEIG